MADKCKKVEEAEDYSPCAECEITEKCPEEKMRALRTLDYLITKHDFSSEGPKVAAELEGQLDVLRDFVDRFVEA